MYTRKIITLAVLVLALVSPVWCSDAPVLLHSHGSSALAAQSAHPDSINLAGPPAYDSGWEALGTRPDPIPVEFTHNLGGASDDYFVSLECRDDTTLGTYDCTDQGFNVNALWYGLTGTTIKVYAAGSLPDDVRVRIWHVHTVYLPVVIKNLAS